MSALAMSVVTSQSPTANHQIWSSLLDARSAVESLDQMRCTVTDVVLSGGQPLIKLLTAPPVGTVMSRSELYRRNPSGDLDHLARARFMGCRLEWPI